MIDLYFAPTANGRRALLALEECELPYQLHHVELGKPKPSALLEVNPLGAIPALIDSDGPAGRRLQLTQSVAIVLYVAEKAGRLVPSDPAGRARVYEWLFHVATDVSPASSSIYYLSNQLPERPTAAIRLFEDRLARFLRNIDHRLEHVEYLAGELSIADLTFFPNYLARRSMVEEIGGLTHLRRWADRMAARPAVERMLRAG
jgi:glutathione S-transferase